MLAIHKRRWETSLASELLYQHLEWRRAASQSMAGIEVHLSLMVRSVTSEEPLMARLMLARRPYLERFQTTEGAVI